MTMTTADAGLGAPGGPVPAALRSTRLRIGDLGIAGELARVPGAAGLVVMARAGCGDAERPRQRLVADVLHGYRLSTLLFDLLGETEVDDSDPMPYLALVHQRLESALRWLLADPHFGRLRLGLFGCGAGATAALLYAVQHPAAVDAVVSRGGMPGRLLGWLPRMQAPTLLIVAGDDAQALTSSRTALRALPCETRLEVMPRVSSRFDGPGVTETVAHLAGSWFANHLPPRAH